MVTATTEKPEVTQKEYYCSLATEEPEPEKIAGHLIRGFGLLMTSFDDAKCLGYFLEIQKTAFEFYFALYFEVAHLGKPLGKYLQFEILEKGQNEIRKLTDCIEEAVSYLQY